MENNGYGQLRQDVGKLMGIGERIEDTIREHAQDDNKRFDEIRLQLSAMQKLTWTAIGFGLQNIVLLIKELVIR